MATTITSPENIVNLALAELGWPLRVNDIRDGSFTAQVALDTYGQTRDSLIENGEWEFAERIVPATLLKQAPVGGYNPRNPWTSAYPSLPWKYEYAYPSDCIKVRSVRPQQLGSYNPDPKFNRFSLDNDNALVPIQRVILCDVPFALITYAGRVTNPTAWDASFTDALVEALCKAMGPKLVRKPSAAEAVGPMEMARRVATRDMK